MAPHSSNFAWKIPWTEEPGGLQSIGLQRVDTTERLNDNNEGLQCIYLGRTQSSPENEASLSGAEILAEGCEEMFFALTRDIIFFI